MDPAGFADCEKMELLRSSVVNFENLGQMAPQLKLHPIYQLALAQLQAAAEKFENDGG